MWFWHIICSNLCLYISQCVLCLAHTSMQAEVCILPCLISQCSCISNFESVVLMHLHSVSWIVAVVRWELHQFVTTLPLSAVQLLIFLFFFTPFLSSYPSRVSCFFSFSSVSFSTFSLASFFCSFFSSSVLYFSTFLSTKLYVLGLKVYCGESFRVFVVLKSGQFSYSFSTNLPCSAHLIKHNACEVFIRIPAVMETPEV